MSHCILHRYIGDNGQTPPTAFPDWHTVWKGPGWRHQLGQTIPTGPRHLATNKLGDGWCVHACPTCLYLVCQQLSTNIYVLQDRDVAFLLPSHRPRSPPWT